MLNYANLNDVEFEALCRDIMERMLKVRMRRFASGPDGGIDLTDDTDTHNIVVQVKHYWRSSTADTVRNLMQELPKVEKLKPNQYYICCSRELSVANIQALYCHFQAYMDSDRNIITKLEIDDFLKMEENRDILKKHFKLWLDDTGILMELQNDDIFVDCEALLDDADQLHKLFVPTQAFHKARELLEKDQTLCIIGDPGVGKSITSKMLALYFASQGYRVRYTSNVCDLTSLKASLRSDPNAKEVILLDDCFGQAYFEMQSSQSSQLISLIKYVKRRENKILILNSRITIFQEVQQRQRDLVQCLERKDFKVSLLDINRLSSVEKAEILYNHLYFSGIPQEYFENIRIEHRYRTIVSHKNYNPRIIEFVCTPKHYQAVASSDYYDFIMSHLENPTEIWKDEYEDRLSSTDRIFLQTLYSLTATVVPVSLVKQCFERRIAGIPSVDKTVDQFQRSVERLNEGFIQIQDGNGQRYLSMQNPSMNDFLNSRLNQNNCERTDLLASICAVNQLRLLPKDQRIPYVIDLLKSNRIDQFIFPSSEDRSAAIGHCIIATGTLLSQYRQDVLNYLLPSRHSRYLPSSLLPEIDSLEKQISNPQFWMCYGLNSFFEESNHFYSFLSLWDLERSVDFICSLDDLFHGSKRIFYSQQVDAYLIEAFQDYCSVDADDYSIYLDIEDAIQKTCCITPDGPDYDNDEAAEILDEQIRAKAYHDFQKITAKLPQHFKHLADQMLEDDFEVSGSDTLVEDFWYEASQPDNKDADEEHDNRSSHDYTAIDEIFNR